MRATTPAIRRAVELLAHCPPLVLAVAHAEPWAWVLALLVIASLVRCFRSAPVEFAAIRWYPSGAFALVRADGEVVPAALLGCGRSGSVLLTLTFAVSGRSRRVRVLRRGQADAFRHLCRRVLSLPAERAPRSPRRLRRASVV